MHKNNCSRVLYHIAYLCIVQLIRQTRVTTIVVQHDKCGHIWAPIKMHVLLPVKLNYLCL